MNKKLILRSLHRVADRSSTSTGISWNPDNKSHGNHVQRSMEHLDSGFGKAFMAQCGIVRVYEKQTPAHGRRVEGAIAYGKIIFGRYVHGFVEICSADMVGTQVRNTWVACFHSHTGQWTCYTSMRARMVLRKKGTKITEQSVKDEMTRPSISALSVQDVHEAMNRGDEASIVFYFCSIEHLNGPQLTNLPN